MWAEDILGKSVHTIRHLEAGTLNLSPAMAAKMNHASGISIEWLMNGNPKAKPIAADGQPYTKAIYDDVRARKKTFATVHAENLRLNAADLFGHIRAILVNANRNKNYYMAIYRIWKAIEELRTEFGQAEDVYPSSGGPSLSKVVPLMEADVGEFNKSKPAPSKRPSKKKHHR